MLITQKLIIEKITESIGNNYAYERLKNFVLSYYSGDTDYIFESVDVENFFTITSSYFETDEFVKEDRKKFLVRLRDGLLRYQSWPEELLIAFRNYNEIKDLIDKYNSRTMNKSEILSEIKKFLYPRNNPNKVLNHFQNFRGHTT